MLLMGEFAGREPAKFVFEPATPHRRGLILNISDDRVSDDRATRWPHYVHRISDDHIHP